MKKQINKSFGWHFLAKECSDFYNCSFFEIMNTPALEVAGLAAIIQQKALYNSLK